MRKGDYDTPSSFVARRVRVGKPDLSNPLTAMHSGRIRAIVEREEPQVFYAKLADFKVMIETLSSVGLVKPPYPLMWMELDDAEFGRTVIVSDCADGRNLVLHHAYMARSKPFVFPRIVKAQADDNGFFSLPLDSYIYDTLDLSELGDDEAIKKESGAIEFLMASYIWALLGCSNVFEVEHQATGRSRIVKTGGKKRREPKLIYKTLVVKNAQGRVVADFSGHGSAMPLHSVRGHFKTYTKERPLLGRHVGTYWFPAHVRGSKEQGEVVKDYDVRVDPVVESGREEPSRTALSDAP